ncbi:unnamed protein product [Prunus armeniaca]|uniref:Uncharacterized protein n=1 Tax=Prunus armeniaca TaxID=36596 RepID=A0A6J5WZU4_PRUAR|nr:unnamed protein product [Prunus armeniaca]
MAIDKCYMLQLGKIDFQLLCSNLERLILNYSIAGNAAKRLPKRDLVNNTVMAEVNEAVVVALGNDDQGTYRWDFKNYGLIEDSGRI